MPKAANRVLIFVVIVAILGLIAYPKLKAAHPPSGPGGAPASAGNVPASAGSVANGNSSSSNSGGQVGPKGGVPGAGIPALPVTSRILRAQRLDNGVRITGTVMANEEIDIRSEMEGKIRSITFKEGGLVKKGDLLVKIEDKELQANVLKAQSQRKLAEDNEYRMRMQLKIEAVSQKDYDQAQNEFNLAKAGELLLRAQLDKTEIRAPFAGIVGLKSVSEGALVNPSTRISTLQEVKPIKVDFSIPGKYAEWVKAGTPISFTVQGSDRRQVGKVYAVDPKIDLETRTLHLRALCPNPDGQVLPGSFATIEIQLQVIEAALIIPTEAMTADSRGAKVYLYHGGKAEPIQVQAGLRLDSVVQITKGLKVGDTVITSGIMQIRQGATVTLSRVD